MLKKGYPIKISVRSAYSVKKFGEKLLLTSKDPVAVNKVILNGGTVYTNDIFSSKNELIFPEGYLIKNAFVDSAYNRGKLEDLPISKMISLLKKIGAFPVNGLNHLGVFRPFGQWCSDNGVVDLYNS